MDQLQMEKELMKFTLSLYNDIHLPRSSVQQVVVNTQNLIANALIPLLEQKIISALRINNTFSAEDKVSMVLNEHKDLFREFNTDKLRIKYYTKNSVYEEPISINIGEYEDGLNEGGKNSTKANKEQATAVYIPLKNSLKRILELPGVYSQVLQYIKELENDENLSNIMQGELWQNKYKLSKGQIVLPLFLYYDDFEPGNALGSHAGKQQLGGVYVTLPFLPPHLSVKLDNILVTLLLYTKYRKKCQNSDIFREVVTEMNFLSSQGLKLDLNGKEQICMYFRCVLITGDNLAANGICGFVESFNETRFCRICRASSKELKQMVQENSDLLRTKENYNRDLYLLGPASGIKESCYFNNIIDFDITENRSLDVMHDLNEGVIHYTLSRLLTQIIVNDKLLTIEQFNKLVKNFNYGESSSINMPQPISLKPGKLRQGEIIINKIKYKQSSSESLMLCKCLGLIIGHIIPVDYKYWKIYIFLRKIACSVTAPTISKSQISLLEYFIMEHNRLYIEFFGNLKPKHHLLNHIAMILRDNGPPIHYSSSANERKNRQLKQIATSNSSHKNVPETVAIRIQLQQCYRIEVCDNLLSYETLGSVNKFEDVDILRYDDSSSLTSYNFVEIYGKKYCPGTIIITGFCENEPQFGKILKIYGSKNDIRFLIADVTYDIFHPHYQAYRCTFVNETPNQMIKLKNIPIYHGPCTATEINNSVYIATNYYV